MNNTSDDMAYAWYLPSTGALRHVTYIKDHAHPPGTVQMALAKDIVTDIMTGKKKMMDYKVVTAADGSVHVILKHTVNHPQSFWALQEVIPFHGEFTPCEKFESPIQVRPEPHGMDVYVMAHVQNAKIYVTLKHDPTWLIKTINVSKAIDQYGLGPIPIELDPDFMYSVYVRYDAAQIV
jgi:hypothetical protein